MITRTSDHIKVAGHRGTWYVIDEGYYTPDVIAAENTIGVKHMFLLEHETYGDEAACVIVDESGELILDDIWNGFEDLLESGWRIATPVRAWRGETMAQFLGRKLLPRR